MGFEEDRILRTYENKDELKNEINKSFVKYISEINDIPESLKDKRVERYIKWECAFYLCEDWFSKWGRII